MTRQKIVFRADGNNQMGLGHVSRCLALAELLSPEFDTCFVTHNPHQALLDTIRKIVEKVVILREPASTRSSKELTDHLVGDEIVVLDGYQFNASYEQELKKHVRAIISIDDLASRDFVADAVINFCKVDSARYSMQFYTRLFTGIEYLFLRSPFLRKAPDKQLIDRIFINMGGADPHNNTMRILDRVASSGYGGRIEVVVGDHFCHWDLVQDRVERMNRVTLHRALPAEQMYSVMAACSIAILPPSTVALEFLSTGGLAFLHQTADNQSLLKQYLFELNLASDFKDFDSILGHRNWTLLFEERLCLQKKVFDGLSLNRVQRIFRDFALGGSLAFRIATLADMQRCFEWANDEEARKYSYSPEPIPWDRHVAWFQKKFLDPASFYFIASIGANDVGQIRFELTEPEKFQISYTLDKNWRGKGLSHFILTKGVQELKGQISSPRIVGYVKKANIASIKAFQRAGFAKLPSDKYPDSFLFQLS